MDKEKIVAMRTFGKGLDNDGAYWSTADKRQLEEAFDTGVGITTIALLLGRSEPAIVQQLAKAQKFQAETQKRRCRKDDVMCCCGKCSLREKCRFSPKNRDNLSDCMKEDDKELV